ncbi:MAG: GNAT family N-acetyltransferase [Cytophagales bacterium]|nr:GNAT family N-acetyltransferase [Rhizobacter sp.]
MHTAEEFLALDRLTLGAQVEQGGKEMSTDQLLRRFEETFPVSQVCTVRRDAMLVAYAMLQPQSETCWFVTCFNVHPLYRTSSVLFELFSEFGSLVRRFGIAELKSNVYKTNQLSLSFHRRLGFRVTRENDQAVEMFTTVAEMAANPSIERTFRRLSLLSASPRSESVVTLEPRTRAHAEELFPVLSEARLYDFLDERPPHSVDALRERLARSESRKSPDGSEHWLNWVVRDATGQAAGYVQATVMATLETNVAYFIGSAHWGRGVAYAAVGQMLRLVEAEFGAKRFFVVVERENVRSIRLAARLGFLPASPEQPVERAISPTEILMERVLP